MYSMQVAVQERLAQDKGELYGHLFEAINNELNFLDTDRAKEIMGSTWLSERTTVQALWGFYMGCMREFGSTSQL